MKAEILLYRFERVRTINGRAIRQYRANVKKEDFCPRAGGTGSKVWEKDGTSAGDSPKDMLEVLNEREVV